jgi:hypothetical protein
MLAILASGIALAGEPPKSESSCLTFEVMEIPLAASKGSTVMERIPISQTDVQSAVFEVWEPSAETRRYFESRGRPVPKPRPQVTVTISERAGTDLEQAMMRYIDEPQPYHLRISRTGFEPIQSRIISELGPVFIVPVASEEEAQPKIQMLTRACGVSPAT